MRLICLALLCLTTQPADTAPSGDSTMNWLLSRATTAPATQPDDIPQTQPAVLQSTNLVSAPTRPGAVTLSDGSSFTGQLSTTLRQPLRVWDASAKRYQDIPFSQIETIQAQVVSESQQPEWRFAQNGSDIKEFSGKTYPVRETTYAVTLKDQTTITGGIAAPIYLDANGARRTFILHKTDKGVVGQTLDQLIYAKEVRFTD